MLLPPESGELDTVERVCKAGAMSSKTEHDSGIPRPSNLLLDVSG